MKQKTLYRTILLIVLQLNSFWILGQEFKPIAKPNSSKWYFAHQQLSGNMVDTIYTNEKQDEWIDLLYHGRFFNYEKTYIGKIKISSDNDKIWYISPDNNYEKLIYDLTLEKGDVFDFGYYQLAVDSVYYLNERKVIDFGLHSHAWGENVKFIEGVGPNTSFIAYYYDVGVLEPLVICKFENSEKEYSIENSNFSDCNILTTGIKKNNPINQILVFPNPTNNWVQIEGLPVSETNFKIYNMSGELIKEIVNNQSTQRIITSDLSRGIYFLNIKTVNQTKTFKIVKL